MAGENDYAGAKFTGDRAAVNYRDFSPVDRDEGVQHAARAAAHYTGTSDHQAAGHRADGWDDAPQSGPENYPAADFNEIEFAEPLRHAAEQTVNFAEHLIQTAFEAVAHLADLDIAQMGYDAGEFAAQETVPHHNADAGAANNAFRSHHDGQRQEGEAAAAA